MLFVVVVKSQIQVLILNKILLLIGYLEGFTLDSISHDTPLLVSALAVATSAVIIECMTRYRYRFFLGFLQQIEKSVPIAFDIH